MTKEELQKLIDRYLHNEVTSKEKEWIDQWYSKFPPIAPEWNKKSKRQLRNDIYQIFEKRLAQKQDSSSQVMIKRLYRLMPYAIAGIFLFFFSYLLFIFLPPNSTHYPIEGYLSKYDHIYRAKPTFVLSDGREFPLSSFFGNLYIKNGSIVNDKDDVILSKQQLSGVSFLTLITPHRSKYQVTLADGSHVWVDAVSRITYPISFEGENRIVQASGQVYFSVTKHPDKPFIVKTSREEIKVLGTEFMLNHYKDEATSYVALLEGSVQVTIPDHGSERLTPGNMVEISTHGAVIKPAVIEEITAWKSGEFVFNDKSLKQVMLELSRWYNIEYQIDPDLMEYRIWGTMSRMESLKTNLENIQQISTGIRFEIKEGRVFVMK